MIALVLTSLLALLLAAIAFIENRQGESIPTRGWPFEPLRRSERPIEFRLRQYAMIFGAAVIGSIAFILLLDLVGYFHSA